MNKKISILFLLAICCLSHFTYAQAVNNTFEESTGANSYSGGLGIFNWVDGNGYGIMNNTGPQAFLSAVGEDYFDLGLIKDLGGTIQDSIYHVSFYVGKYSGEGITFADFSELRIGGPNGIMQWIQTPEPTVYGVWYQWTGTYTPDSTDIGLPFTFSIVFDLYALHTIAIDGPVIATSSLSTSASVVSDETSFEIFPNPCNGVLHVRYHSNENGKATFILMDELGRKVLKQSIEGKEGILQVDVNGLEEGIYFYGMVSEKMSLMMEKVMILRNADKFLK